MVNGKCFAYTFVCMTFRGLTISSEAYEKLKSLKKPGDSFSDVLLRDLPAASQQGQEQDWQRALRVLKLCLTKSSKA